MASPGGRTTGGLDRVLNDDLRFRIFNLLSVVELQRVSVSHKFLRMFRDPQLWKTRVETLLPMLAPNARRAVERCLSGGAYIWCQQLQCDYDWQTRLGLLRDTPSSALQLKRYMCDHVYERIYRDMARFEMVSVRMKRPGRSNLVTIPFVQTIYNTKTGELLRVFRIKHVDDGHFLACCTWKDAKYTLCVNGKKMEKQCLLRVGDTLQMVRKKSGKVREFEMKLAMDSDIGFVERYEDEL